MSLENEKELYREWIDFERQKSKTAVEEIKIYQIWTIKQIKDRKASRIVCAMVDSAVERMALCRAEIKRYNLKIRELGGHTEETWNKFCETRR